MFKRLVVSLIIVFCITSLVYAKKPVKLSNSEMQKVEGAMFTFLPPVWAPVVYPVEPFNIMAEAGKSNDAKVVAVVVAVGAVSLIAPPIGVPYGISLLTSTGMDAHNKVENYVNDHPDVKQCRDLVEEANDYYYSPNGEGRGWSSGTLTGKYIGLSACDEKLAPLNDVYLQGAKDGLIDPENHLWATVVVGSGLAGNFVAGNLVKGDIILKNVWTGASVTIPKPIATAAVAGGTGAIIKSGISCAYNNEPATCFDQGLIKFTKDPMTYADIATGGNNPVINYINIVKDTCELNDNGNSGNGSSFLNNSTTYNPFINKSEQSVCRINNNITNSTNNSQWLVNNNANDKSKDTDITQIIKDNPGGKVVAIPDNSGNYGLYYEIPSEPKNMNAFSDKLDSSIKDLERMKSTLMANAANPTSAAEIAKQYDMQINALLADKTKFEDQAINNAINNALLTAKNNNKGGGGGSGGDSGGGSGGGSGGSGGSGSGASGGTAPSTTTKPTTTAVIKSSTPYSGPTLSDAKSAIDKISKGATVNDLTDKEKAAYSSH